MSEKKRYIVGCTAPADWEYIHELLTQDGTLDDNIPTEAITSDDLKEHSPTRASYLLTDEEAALVEAHEKVLYCHIAQEDFSPPQEELHATPQEFRQVGISSHYRRWENFNLLTTTGGNTQDYDMSRTGFQLLRHTQAQDLWYDGTSNGGRQVFDNRVARYGGGKNVDIIVCDEGFWLGHIEFYNPSDVRDISDSTTDGNGDPYVFGPSDMIEGNVLNRNGRCYALDLIVDAPYYIDPDFFNASPGTRLETRWDGTTVPVSSVAVNWWRNNTTTYRSVGFTTFGTANVSTAYNRTDSNGTNTSTAYNSTHGTQCAAAAFGRTQGWAYNANKWVLNLYGSRSSGIEAGHDAQKLFHIMKPNNSELGTKDPTISSNSWGYRAIPDDTGYYFYRGAAGSSYSCTASNAGRSPYSGTNNKPGFMRWVGYHGDGYRMKGEHPPNSGTQALDELINAGVIWVGAAGNSNQKQVSWDHPDFNNYWNTGVGSTVGDNFFYEFGVRKYPYTNRRGWPQHGGMIRSGVGGTVYTYPVINIGALDDDYWSNHSYKESKVNYSDMGNEIDCYAAADGILTAKNVSGSGRARHDTKPSGESGFTYYYDNKFSGTSAACPVAAGLIATKLEYNRNWGWQDVRNWLRGENQPVGVTTLARQLSTEFHFGSDTGVSGAGDGSGGPWSDTRSLEGSLPIVIYDAPTGNEPGQSSGSPVIEGVKVFSGDGMEITGNFTISRE
tara:strand:- start:427 stop:2598 length:2172 start_codon:yes stop_codon:yes gene_type:complete